MSERLNPFARSVTSFGASPHHCEAHHLHAVQHCSFVSACGGMMLTFGQMMLRPTDTTEKIPKAYAFGILGDELTKKMPTEYLKISRI